MLGSNGVPVFGYARKDCVVIKNADTTKCRIQWKDKKDVFELAGKTVY